MEEKKKFEKPTIDIVELKSKGFLLASPPNGQSGGGGNPDPDDDEDPGLPLVE